MSDQEQPGGGACRRCRRPDCPTLGTYTDLGYDYAILNCTNATARLVDGLLEILKGRVVGSVLAGRDEIVGKAIPVPPEYEKRRLWYEINSLSGSAWRVGMVVGQLRGRVHDIDGHTLIVTRGSGVSLKMAAVDCIPDWDDVGNRGYLREMYREAWGLHWTPGLGYTGSDGLSEHRVHEPTDIDEVTFLLRGITESHRLRSTTR